MLHAALTMLATAAQEGHEEPKTAFYVAGGILALYAVLVSALGIVKHDFPSSKGAAGGVMGLAVLLVAATLVTAVTTS